MRKFLLIAGLIIILINLCGCTQKEASTVYVPAEFLDLEVNKVASTSEIEVKLISVERIKSYYSDIFKSTEESELGNTYILIEAEIKNIFSESVSVGSSSFLLIDNEENIYAVAFYIEEDSFEISEELSSGQVTNGKILFEIPESINDFKIQYMIF